MFVTPMIRSSILPEINIFFVYAYVCTFIYTLFITYLRRWLNMQSSTEAPCSGNTVSIHLYFINASLCCIIDNIVSQSSKLLLLCEQY